MTNNQGGINPQTQEELSRAKQVDLITLPLSVKGTNCGNCKWFKEGFCTNPKVNQVVNDRMCCAVWDNKEVQRPWLINKLNKLREMLK